MMANLCHVDMIRYKFLTVWLTTYPNSLECNWLVSSLSCHSILRCRILLNVSTRSFLICRNAAQRARAICPIADMNTTTALAIIQKKPTTKNCYFPLKSHLSDFPYRTRFFWFCAEILSDLMVRYGQ